MTKIKFWLEYEGPYVAQFETFEDFKRVKQFYETNSESIIGMRIYCRENDGMMLFKEDEIKNKLDAIESYLFKCTSIYVSAHLSSLNINHDIEYYESEIGVKVYPPREGGIISKYIFNKPMNKADAEVILLTVIEKVIHSYPDYRREMVEKLIKEVKEC